MGYNSAVKSSAQGSIHAELSMILKIHNTKSIRRKRTIDILVVNFSKDGILKNSKPCYNCLLNLKKYSKKKNITISKIYYSDGISNIVCSNLFTLLNSDEKHVTRFYRAKGIVL